MSEKLLPCPLCGPGQVSLNPPSETYRYGSINCPGCMLTLPGEIKDQREMIEVWNTRPDHAPTSWRHIETAPRDGTPFLCFHPDDVFSPQTGIDLIWYEPSIKTYTQDGDNEVPFAGITHWMPLPSPPQKGER